MKQGLVLIIYMLISIPASGQHEQIAVIYKNSIKSPIDSTTYMNIPKDNHNLKTDSIANKLLKKGYYDHLLKKTLRNDSVIRYEFTLNKRYTHIKINEYIKTKRNTNNLFSLSRKRNIIPINDIENYLNKLKKELTQQGYSFTEINLERIKITASDTIEAQINTNISNKRHIDKIVIKGYKKFPISLLRNFTNNKNTFNNQITNKLEKSIANMPFVKKIKESEVLFKKDSTQIFLYLEKINTNTADGLIGFNNSDNGKLELNGFINLKLQNNLNRAETFLLQYRNDNNDQTLISTSLSIPYLWNGPLGNKSNLNIQRRDSTYQRTEFKTGLFYKPNWQSNVGINYTNTTSNATGETIDNEDFTKNGIELFYEVRKETTNQLMPEDLYLNTSVGVNKRELSNKSENQFNFHATFLKLWHLNSRSKVLNRLITHYLESNTIQFNELYQFGGLGSIRGFNQNSIDSSFYTTLATEYRYRLNDQIYVHSILDFGIFENFNTKKTESLVGYGGGIAILTQAGILNLSIANGKFNKAKVDLSSTVAHINLKIYF
ncbi:hypothetical protein [Nonlabens sp.]|uniref:hypothetical protein n=1 Tax=Nonlabens sp. TaxID=1888209 RepID=UPI003F69A822